MNASLWIFGILLVALLVQFFRATSALHSVDKELVGVRASLKYSSSGKMASDMLQNVLGKLADLDTDPNSELDSPSLSDRLIEIGNDLGGLKDHLFESHQELERFREGYDLRIQKKMALPLLTLIDELESESKSSIHPEGAKLLRRLVEDLILHLENGGILPYKPALGEPVLGNESRLNVVERVEAPAELHQCTMSTLRVGYLYMLDSEDSVVLRPADVIVGWHPPN